MRLHQVDRTAEVAPPPPTLTEISDALLALAHAVDIAHVSVARLNDGSTRTDVSTIGVDEAGHIVDRLLGGMTGVRSEQWTAGTLLVRESTGRLLGAVVRVVGCTRAPELTLAGAA